jgi:Tfp pilus assembly protein PilP
VARQATYVNALNLSRLNLIGVYGTASNRHALVRTSSGRYTKVRVGDRLDGGTVAAITSSELRYRKSGQMVTLAMPRG